MFSAHVQEMLGNGNAQLRDKVETRNSVPTESLTYGSTKPENNMEATFSA